MTLRAALRATTALVAVTLASVLPAAALAPTAPGGAVFIILPGATATSATVAIQMPNGVPIPIGTLNPTTGKFTAVGLGQPGGPASLSSSGTVPAAQLPIGTAGGVVGVGGPVDTNMVKTTGETTSRTTAAHLADFGVTPLGYGASVGTGGDDTAALQAAINAASNTLGQTGFVILPPPPSGYYNVCSGSLALPTQSSLVIEGSGVGAKPVIRVLPGCASSPASVFTQGGSNANVSNVVMRNFVIDGYCLATHDLDVAYSRRFLAENMTFRNVAAGGSNVRFQSGTQNGFGFVSFEERLGAGNLIENVNDSGHTCYNTAADLPLYNLENHASDSDFSGLIAVNARVANFYSDGGGSFFGPGTHGWGTSVALLPQYNFWLTGVHTLDTFDADGQTVAGVRLTGSGGVVHGGIFQGPNAATVPAVLFDAGVNSARVTDNNWQYYPLGLQTTGPLSPSNIVENNIGAGSGARPSTDNRIINGDWSIDQRREGAQFSAAGGNVGDRWYNSQNAGQSWQINTRRTDTGCGGSSYGLIMVPSGTSTPTAAQFDLLDQKIDGGDIRDLAWGTSLAKDAVFSFWGRASTAGTYSVSLRNGAGTRSYVSTVNLTTACTYFSLRIPGDVGGTGANTFNTSVGQAGLDVGFDLGSGTNFQTSNLNVWQNGNFTEAAGAAQPSTGVTMTFSSVRLRQGSFDVPYLPRSPSDEMNLARQFYRKSFPSGIAVAQNAGIAGAKCFRAPVAGAYGSVQIPFEPPMRKTSGALAVTTYNPSAANANWRDVTAAADVTVTVDPSSAVARDGVEITTGVTVATAGDNVCVQISVDGEL